MSKSTKEEMGVTSVWQIQTLTYLPSNASNSTEIKIAKLNPRASLP